MSRDGREGMTEKSRLKGRLEGVEGEIVTASQRLLDINPAPKRGLLDVQ